MKYEIARITRAHVGREVKHLLTRKWLPSKPQRARFASWSRSSFTVARYLYVIPMVNGLINELRAPDGLLNFGSSGEGHGGMVY